MLELVQTMKSDRGSYLPADNAMTAKKAQPSAPVVRRAGALL